LLSKNFKGAPSRRFQVVVVVSEACSPLDKAIFRNTIPFDGNQPIICIEMSNVLVSVSTRVTQGLLLDTPSGNRIQRR
jgi:hypothetical protein